MLTGIVYKIYYIDHLVEGFVKNFNRYYADALATDFNSLQLTEQADYVKLLYRVLWIAFLLSLYLSYPLPPSPLPFLLLPSSPTLLFPLTGGAGTLGGAHLQRYLCHALLWIAEETCIKMAHH